LSELQETGSVCRFLGLFMFVCLPSVRLLCRYRSPILFLTLWLSTSTGFGQHLAVPPVPQEETVSSHVAYAAQADTGYWIVSTHGSPQSFNKTCPQFRPCVTRVECAHRANGASLAEMCQALTPGVPVCINIHGSYVGEQDVIEHSALTYHWLGTAACGQSVQLINFSWPTSPRIILPTVKIDINRFGRRAARNGWYLAELIRYIPPECPICLLGHSHGTRVIASALHLMAGGCVQGVAHPSSRANGRRIRTVFAAAAIRRDWLNPGERYGRALCSTECLINLKNPHDAALLVYPLRHLFSGHALGATGLSRRNRRGLGGWSAKVAEYDVSGVVGFRHMWPHYATHSSLAWLIRNYVFFPDARPASVEVSGSGTESVLLSNDTAS
jgi:hypothetical protein